MDGGACDRATKHENREKRRDGVAGKVSVSVRSDNHSRETISAIFGRRDSMSLLPHAGETAPPALKELSSSCAP